MIRQPQAAEHRLHRGPLLYYDEDKKTWFGGMFSDGRATGWTVGDPSCRTGHRTFFESAGAYEGGEPSPQRLTFL